MTGASLYLRTYATGNKFFLFDLPTTEHPISIGSYTISNHHLTVHADPIGSLDLKSQYHYTASFVDKAGQEYRLHVYFNAEDNYVGEPQLSYALPEGNFESLDCQEHLQEFLWLAQSACKDVVKQIRQRQNQLVTALQERYNEEENKATSLSIDLVKNKELYLSAIDRQLKNYSNNTHFTQGIISYLNKVKIALAKPLPTFGKNTITTEPPDEKRESKQEIRRPQSKFFKKPALSSKTIILHGITIPQKTGLTQLIFELNVELEQIKRMSGDLLISSITNLFNELLDIDIDLEIGIYDASIEDIVALHQLQNNFNKQGKRVLEQLLANAQCDVATKLTPFYHLIEKTPHYLHANNPELIDFLLKNKILPVDYKNFTLFGKNYVSVVDYYFQISKVNISTIRCFDAFIKNGLSLMEIDRNTGLPFAAILLLQPQHPLRVILEDNAHLTINNPMFYRQLNGILKTLIVLPDCTELRRTQITALIENNQIAIDSLRSRTFKSTKQTDAEKEFEMQILAEYGKELITKVQTDPEVVTLNRIYKKRSVTFLSSLSSIHRHQTNSEKINLTQSLYDSWKSLDVKPSLTFQDLKKDSIKHLLDQIKMMDLDTELTEIQTKLKVNVSYTGKLTLNLKKRAREIIKELETLERSCEVPEKKSIPNTFFTKVAEHLSKVFPQTTQQLSDLKDINPELIQNLSETLKLEKQRIIWKELFSDDAKAKNEKKETSISLVP